MGRGVCKTMKKIEIDNPLILEALQKKEKWTTELNDIAKEEEKLIVQGNKIMAKLAKENEKVLPMMKEEQGKIELEEYEEVSRTYLGLEGDEVGKVFIEVSDRLEEFKASYKKNGTNNNSNPNEGIGRGKDNAGKSTKGN